MAAHAVDRGGAPDGTLGISLEQFYGDELVCLELEDGDSAAYLTPAQAREVAEDLLAHAAALESGTLADAP